VYQRSISDIHRIRGSHSGGYEEFCLLGYNVVKSTDSWPTFWKNMLLALSGSKSKTESVDCQQIRWLYILEDGTPYSWFRLGVLILVHVYVPLVSPLWGCWKNYVVWGRFPYLPSVNGTSCLVISELYCCLKQILKHMCFSLMVVNVLKWKFHDNMILLHVEFCSYEML
jgi:hypothetical protein